MRKTITNLTAMFAAMLALAGCGGGRDGAPAPTGPDADTVQITAELGTILAASDTLLMTGYDAVNPEPSRNGNLLQGINASCQGSVCRNAMPPNRTVRLSDIGTYDDYGAVAERFGVSSAVASTMERDSTGSADQFGVSGWMSHSMFVVDRIHFFDSARNWQGSLVGSVSVGNDTGSRPGAGSAIWTGIMFGADEDDDYIGTASVRVDFADADLDMAFNGIRNVSTGVGLPDMHWTDIAVGPDGRFASGRTLVGTFYGPGHAEVGGVFERDEITGAFGAHRD